jgi:hypothetical protein
MQSEINTNRRKILIAISLTLPLNLRSENKLSRAGLLLQVQNNEQEKTFFSAFYPLLKSENVSAFKFERPCEICHRAELTIGAVSEEKKSVRRELSQEDRGFFISILSRPGSYIFNLQKAMPFFADYGLSFEGGSTPNYFLLSSFGRTGRLVLNEKLPADISIVNLDPVFGAIIGRLHEVLGS